MIKVFALATILLVTLSAMAIASTTNWTLGILAEGNNQFMADRWNVIGAWDGYTDGINSGLAFMDLDPGAEGTAPPSSGGKWVAVRQTTNPVGTVDVRDHFSPTVPSSKTWTMDIFYYTVLSEGTPDSLTLTIKTDVDKKGKTISGSDGDLPSTDGLLSYRYSFQLNDGPVTTYSAADIPAALMYTINTPHDSTSPDRLTITVQTVPEPGSIMALVFGLAGVISIRKFKHS